MALGVTSQTDKLVKMTISYHCIKHSSNSVYKMCVYQVFSIFYRTTFCALFGICSHCHLQINPFCGKFRIFEKLSQILGRFLIFNSLLNWFEELFSTFRVNIKLWQIIRLKYNIQLKLTFVLVFGTQIGLNQTILFVLHMKQIRSPDLIC